MGLVFVDGDFPSGKPCKFHCSPSCHPAQIGPDWLYGCLHPSWPANKEGDFCPIVNCGGDINKCECKIELIKKMLSGKKRSLTYAKRKINKINLEIEDIESFMEAINGISNT